MCLQREEVQLTVPAFVCMASACGEKLAGSVVTAGGRSVGASLGRKKV